MAKSEVKQNHHLTEEGHWFNQIMFGFFAASLADDIGSQPKE